MDTIRPSITSHPRGFIGGGRETVRPVSRIANKPAMTVPERLLIRHESEGVAGNAISPATAVHKTGD